MGVVIGETAEVGNDILIYMGVVLGGTALENVNGTRPWRTVLSSVRRNCPWPYPDGKGAKVGAGSVVVRSVPPGATVVGVPGRIAGPDCGPTAGQGIEGMPDPMLRVVSRLLDRQNRLEERLRSMESALPHRKPRRSKPSMCARI